MLLLWISPFLLVVALLATGWAGGRGTGLAAALAAGLVAVTVAPLRLDAPAVLTALATGLWLSALLAGVILGGLFFREVVAGAGATPSLTAPARAQAFTACFLVGPFSEAATGFGVGQVTAVAMLSTLGLSPLNMVVLALFSQILVPWGAMANGTLVGAAFAGLPGAELGVASAWLSLPLLLGWLVMFWKIAGAAGLPASAATRFGEAGWVLVVALALMPANAWLGPEVAGLAVLGPAIALRFVLLQGAGPARLRAILPIALPYALLVGCLAATRAITPLHETLAAVAEWRPFPQAPALAPLLYPGTWLLMLGLLVGRRGTRAPAALRAWSRGGPAMLTIGLFLVAASLMAASGIATALAGAMTAALGQAAILATPLLGGAFGFLTGSGNASNGLLMTAQIAMSADLPVTWKAALQNTAACALTMLSPARVAMGCALVGMAGMERAVYRRAMALGAWPLLAMTLAAALLLMGTG